VIRSGAVALVSLLFSASAFAQSPDLIAADRPGLSDSSAVVGKGRLQIETGVQWEQRSGETSTFFPTLFRVGLSKRLEARIEGDTYTTIAARDLHESGLTPVALGFKAALGGGGTATVGLIASFTPAWGTGAFAEEKASADVRLAVDWALAERWVLYPNVGLAWTEGASGPFIPALLAVTLGYQPKPTIEWFIDAAAELPEAEGGTASVVVDAGVAYIFRRRWQIDVSVGTRAHGDTGPKPFVGVGLSFRTR
jgi:hypothetical protein